MQVNSAFFNPIGALLISILICCTTQKRMKVFKEEQLTFDRSGHFLNHRQSISPDNNWAVFDSRNNDDGIGATERIAMVNLDTREIKKLYETKEQTPYGPGVGAATFSPTENKVIFIHGIKNSNKDNPYSFTRRTGVSVSLDNVLHPIFMDGRDITAPFTKGALRGGTHAHSWSGDGQMISFTYNDAIIEKLSLTNSNFRDLRTVGIMFPKKVFVNDSNNSENNNGEMFSVIISKVNKAPQFGSNEIDKAFDECWIGVDGYIKENGERQKKAIAFQGNVKNDKGETITEIFIVDLPNDLTKEKSGYPLEGTTNSSPSVPFGVSQRRITFSNAGVVGTRHWLSSNPDGNMISFLSKDKNEIINIFTVSPTGGEIKQMTFHSFDVTSGANFSPDGKYIAYAANQAVFLTEIETNKSFQISNKATFKNDFIGNINWSKNGDFLIYNKPVYIANQSFLQIFKTSFEYRK